MRWWVLVVGLGLFGACPAPCDRSTCVGCCDSSGECFGGANRRACGRAGSVCQVCEANERCQGGSCVAPATDGGEMMMVDAGPVELCGRGCRHQTLGCLPGNLPEACGGDGGVCAVCAMSQRCELGRCVNAACTGCVDAVGTCHLGVDDFTCGSGGGLCRTCAASERCRLQTCVVQSCNSSNCSTCCQGVSCVTSTTLSCGLGGVVCVACPSGKTCVSGMCR